MLRNDEWINNYLIKGDKDNVPMIGVSNHNLAEIREADAILKAHGLKLSCCKWDQWKAGGLYEDHRAYGKPEPERFDRHSGRKF